MQQRMAAWVRREMSLDAIRENDLKADMIFACGPYPNAPCHQKLCRSKMALSVTSPWKSGWPAGLVPVWPVSASPERIDAHTHVHNKRVCKDGPVFLAYGGGTVMNTSVTSGRSRAGKIR